MKRLVRLIVLAAVIAAVVSVLRGRRRTESPLPRPSSTPTEPWPPVRPEPSPPPTAAPAPKPSPSADAAPTSAVEPEPHGTPVADAGATWVVPTGEGDCPEGYPIKAKMSSKIFHSPGQLNYDRTTPDRCYVSAGAAEADGLRAAKR